MFYTLIKHRFWPIRACAGSYLYFKVFWKHFPAAGFKFWAYGSSSLVSELVLEFLSIYQCWKNDYNRFYIFLKDLKIFDPSNFFPIKPSLICCWLLRCFLCSNTHNKLKFSHVLLTFQAIARYCRDLQTKSNRFCIIRVPSQTQSQHIVIHLARNADKGGGVLMSIIPPNLNHSFISPVPVPDSGFRFQIRISGFSIRPYCACKTNMAACELRIKCCVLESCCSFHGSFPSRSTDQYY